jgi:hypothetical protein
MDKDTTPDDPAPETPENQPVDLSALQGFDFGTSWSESKSSGGGSRSFDRRPRHGDHRPRGDQAERKDRRPFKPGSFRKLVRRDGDGQGRPPRGSEPGRKPMGRPDVPKKVIEVSFYPEDNGFKALCKALRISSITYELFDIARTILEKEERFYMIIRPAVNPGEAGDEASLYVVESDGIPFLSKEAASQHALSNCLEHFFTTETTEVEAPTGSFSSIRKCGFTGELLGPPNFHRIKTIMADHHATKLSHMPFAKFESKIESVTEEEVIAEWVEKMKTQTSYTLKAEFGDPRSFEDGETARAFVKANLSDKMVRPLNSVRVEGTQISQIKDGLLKANLEFAWDRQKRFPLGTANLLRGRLRRQKFALYKKGSKGVSFVCAVKRRFREPKEAFSVMIEKLLNFLEANPLLPAKELAEKYLGFPTHAPEGEPALEMTKEQQTQFKAMTLDFQWLLKEGYIAEYSDGTIFAHPAAGPGQGVVPAKAEKPVKLEASKEEVAKEESAKSESSIPTTEVIANAEPPVAENAVAEEPKEVETPAAKESAAEVEVSPEVAESDEAPSEAKVEVAEEETPAAKESAAEVEVVPELTESDEAPSEAKVEVAEEETPAEPTAEKPPSKDPESELKEPAKG